MNFLKKLFGAGEPTREENNPAEKSSDKEAAFHAFMQQFRTEANTPEKFDLELADSLRRYLSDPSLQPVFTITDKQTGREYKPHEAFTETYERWKGIYSIWDRRSVLYEHLDSTEFSKLAKWQIIERFVKDRRALNAHRYKEANMTVDDLQDIRAIVALSKLYRTLNSAEDARHYAEGAYKLRPDLDIVLVEYASVLHLFGSEEEKALAHQLIGQVLEKRIKDSEEKEIGLLNFFLFSENYIDSSVFAIEFLYAGKCDLSTWDRMAEEYYYCPVFRYAHAALLSENNESTRAFAKLSSLADEFPWYKMAVQATIDSISQMRKQSGNPGMMEDVLERMKNHQSVWKH